MSKTNETMQPEAVETGTLKLDVTVRPIAPKENLIGFANVTFNDSFVVEGFRICTGDKGIYINMPSAKDSQGNWRRFQPAVQPRDAKPVRTGLHLQADHGGGAPSAHRGHRRGLRDRYGEDAGDP